MKQPLESLAALALDCQTTGANAERHHLLEVGWVTVGTSPAAGRVISATEGATGRELAALASSAHSRIACRRIFTSAATYDRLRVLTTELRRLLAEDRRVTLFPAVGAPVGNKGLERLLDLI